MEPTWLWGGGFPLPARLIFIPGWRRVETSFLFRNLPARCEEGTPNWGFGDLTPLHWVDRT